jgi:cell division protein FtsZ
MAVGTGSGDDRAMQAAEQAMASPMLDVTIDGAKGILFNVTGGSDLSLFEINQAASIIRESAHPDVNLIFGAVIDETLGDEIRITVIATGFDHSMPMVRSMGRPVSKPTTSGSLRRETTPVSDQPKPSSTEPPYRVNDIDVPAFLRKKR